MAFMGRTDLACEALSLQELEKVREHGIVAESSFIHGLELFSVEVISSEGAALLGKPIGKYYTLSLGSHFPLSSESLTSSANAISEAPICLKE